MQFNLLHEPWIAVMKKDGTHTEVGLLELFDKAHEYAFLAGDSKAQDVALMRFMLGVLHRVFSQVDAAGVSYKQTSADVVLGVWKDLYDLGHFPAAIRDYLTRWHDRFDLYDEKYPFYQVPAEFFIADAVKAEDKKMSVTALDGNILKSANVNKLKICATRAFGDGAILSHAEAARWLIYRQHFDVAAGKGYWKDSKAVKAERNSDVSAFFVSFGTKLGHLWIQGASLWETLMLNFVMLSHGVSLFDYEPVCTTAADLPGVPFWELDDVPVPADENQFRNLPLSPVALLCLRSRMVHLIPEENGVRYFWSTYGDYVDWSNNNTEQNSLFRILVSKDKSPVREPDRTISSRFFESFSGVVASDTSGVIDWLRCLQANGHLGHERAFIFSGLCVELGDATGSIIKDIHAGEMSFSSVLLQNTMDKACNCISKELQIVKDISYEVGRLAENFLSCKVKTQVGKNKIGQVKGVTDTAKGYYMDEAGRIVLDWFRKLSDVDVTENLVASCITLRKSLVREARRLGENMFNALPSYSGRTDGTKAYVPERYLKFFCENLLAIERGVSTKSKKGKGSSV